QNSDIYRYMRSCGVFLYRNQYVDVGLLELGEGGNGEFLNVLENERVKIGTLKHIQGNRTFWSLANLINSNKIKIENLEVVSDSIGSLIDIFSNDVEIENIDIDYSGGVFDLTSEWGLHESKNSNIKIGKYRNVVTDDYLLIYSAGSSQGVSSFKNVEVVDIVEVNPLIRRDSIEHFIAKDLVYNDSIMALQLNVPAPESDFNRT